MVRPFAGRGGARFGGLCIGFAETVQSRWQIDRHQHGAAGAVSGCLSTPYASTKRTMLNRRQFSHALPPSLRGPVQAVLV
jgi:hypothetical protein